MPEQALLAKFRKCLAREARFGVDRRRVGAGHVGGRAGTGSQVVLPCAGGAGARYSMGLDCHLKSSPMAL